MSLKELAKDIINGLTVTKQDIEICLGSPIDELLKQSKMITEHTKSNRFSLCSIINGKSGRCSENCKFCAQSVYSSSDVEEYDILDAEDILTVAKKNYANGIKRFSIVTSGKRASKKDIVTLCEIYERLQKECGINLCASHGLLKYDDFLKLKASGVKRYHNNLETSRRYFEKICTTHTYDEKIQTIKEAQKAGLEVCSGGILGLGESMQDRIDMAFELRDLEIKSIPINILNALSGTALENAKPVEEDEILRTCAIFRFINPNATLRLAGGRGLLKDKGRKAFAHCINGSITGELLTTTGNDTKQDLRMIKEIGYQIND